MQACSDFVRGPLRPGTAQVWGSFSEAGNGDEHLKYEEHPPETSPFPGILRRTVMAHVGGASTRYGDGKAVKSGSATAWLRGSNAWCQGWGNEQVGRASSKGDQGEEPTLNPGPPQRASISKGNS